MSKYAFFAMAILLSGCASAPPQEQVKDMPIERAAWQVRSGAAITIGRLQAMQEITAWCAYEQKQPQPDPRACALLKAEMHEIDVVGDVQLIRATLDSLKAKPQTLEVKAHHKVLEADLKKINAALQPVTE